MEKIRYYLAIFRAHSAPSTIIPFVIFYVLSGGNIWTLKFLLFLPLPIMVHWFGFGHNSLMDTARGYDTKDPHKQHHPLVAGLVSLEQAHKVIHTGLLLFVLYGCWYIYRFAVEKVLAALCFVFGYACGHAYNDGLDKATHWKWVPEALTATFMVLAINFINSTTISYVVLVAVLALFMIHAFQIFFEGELKEIEFMHEVNILRTLGSRVATNEEGQKILIISRLAKAFAWAIQIIKTGLIYYLAWLMCIYNIILVTPYMAGMLWLTYKLLKSPRLYDHDKDLDYMAGAEIMAFFGSVMAVANAIGYIESALLCLFSIAWLVGFNKIQWGSGAIGPKV